MMKRTKLWRGLAATGGVMLGCLVFLTSLLYKWEGNVNIALNTLPPMASASGDTNYYPSSFGDGTISDENFALMREASDAHDVQTMTEGAVLVKNDGNALPLKSDERRVTLFGRAVADPVYRGNSGGASVDSSRLVSLKSALEAEGFAINDTLYQAYANSSTQRIKVAVENGSGEKSSIGEEDISFYTSVLQDSYADDYNDVAIVMFSRDGGEGRDLFYSDADGVSQLSLHKQEADLLKMIENSGKFGKTIVLINSAYAMELGWVERQEYGVDACLWIGGTGLKGFTGVAELLTGKADPSGHFVDTYAANSLSSAAVQNAFDHSFSNYDGNYIVEAEGIYVGYKYYETRYQDQVLGINNATGSAGAFEGDTWDYAAEMAYPFGYGLSYADFTQEVESIVWDTQKHEVTATVKVTNNGCPDGSAYGGKSKSVVQLYVQLPYEEGMAEKSAIQLVDYAKTGLLGKGESETVTITVSDYLFATYDMNVVNGADSSRTGCYVFDGGDYYFAIGNDCHDALNNVLAARGESGMFDQFGTASEGDASKAVLHTLESTDNTTYAGSRYTDNVVSNIFDELDYNHWFEEDVVTYLTRSDWNTFPETYSNLEASPEMIEQMENLSYTKHANAPSYDSFTQNAEVTLTLAEMRDVDFGDDRWETFINQLSISDMTNMIGENFGQGAIEKIGKQANTNSDGPAGPQAGYKGNEPTMRVNEVVAASTWNKQILSDRGTFIAEDCLYGGTTQLWSPGCNIHRTPFSGRNFEYYSEDSIMSYHCSAAQCAAMQAGGVNASPKHFAGNDQETNRSGLCVYYNEQAFRQGPLKGFEGAFTEGGALGTMMSCSRIGNYEVYACRALLTDVLRGEWDFKGVTITDSVASWQANDNPTILSLASGTDTFNARKASGTEVRMYIVQNRDGYLLQQLRLANKHFFYAMSRSNIINGFAPGQQAENFTPWWKGAIIAIDVTVGVLTAACIVFYVLYKAKVVGKEEEKA